MVAFFKKYLKDDEDYRDAKKCVKEQKKDGYTGNEKIKEHFRQCDCEKLSFLKREFIRLREEAEMGTTFISILSYAISIMGIFVTILCNENIVGSLFCILLFLIVVFLIMGVFFFYCCEQKDIAIVAVFMIEKIEKEKQVDPKKICIAFQEGTYELVKK